MISVAIICLALNIYHEARNQPVAGQIAVSEVVLNRVKDTKYPNTICEVVYQAKYEEGSNLPIRNQCQFSWYCDGAKDDVNKNSKAWRYSLEYASIVLSGRIVLDITEGATHYHATYVRPAWARTKTKTTRIDRHIFYRWEK